MDAAAQLDLGQTNLDDRYRLVRLIDSGSAADVYEARHLTTHRRVAVKVFRATGHLSAEHLARFQREARVIGELRHPNIVQVLDASRLADGRPYIVMEYLEGTNLREHLNQPESRDLGVIDLVTQTAAALDRVHALEIVHRDVKPENLFVCESGVVKLLDFGLVCPIHSDSKKRLTLEGICNGTPEYMPPEVTQQRYATESFDIYALAVIAFELITGQLPFSDPNRLAVLVQKREQPAPTLASVTGEEYPEALERVIAQGLDRDPARRPRTAGRFAAELTAALVAHGPSRPRQSLAPGKMNRWDVLGQTTSQFQIAAAPLRGRSRQLAGSDTASKPVARPERPLRMDSDSDVAITPVPSNTKRYLMQLGGIAALVGVGVVAQNAMTSSATGADAPVTNTASGFAGGIEHLELPDGVGAPLETASNGAALETGTPSVSDPSVSDPSVPDPSVSDPSVPEPSAPELSVQAPGAAGVRGDENPSAGVANARAQTPEADAVVATAERTRGSASAERETRARPAAEASTTTPEALREQQEAEAEAARRAEWRARRHERRRERQEREELRERARQEAARAQARAARNEAARAAQEQRAAARQPAAPTGRPSQTADGFIIDPGF